MRDLRARWRPKLMFDPVVGYQQFRPIDYIMRQLPPDHRLMHSVARASYFNKILRGQS
jgi:hypothetical protein